MKFRGNNRKSHLLAYCALLAAIVILVGPLYAISYNTLKEQVFKDSQAAVSRGMSRCSQAQVSRYLLSVTSRTAPSLYMATHCW